MTTSQDISSYCVDDGENNPEEIVLKRRRTTPSAEKIKLKDILRDYCQNLCFEEDLDSVTQEEILEKAAQNEINTQQYMFFYYKQ